MWHRFTALEGRTVDARGGEVGSVQDIYFDDERWGVRYLVVRTGGWLNQRDVLLSPASLDGELAADGHLRLNLTRDQVRNAPSIDEDEPVSRHYEAAHARYYRYPFYWIGPYLWGGAMDPGLPPLGLQDPWSPEEPARDAELAAAERSHLRSCKEVRGYKADAADGAAGHVDDFLIDGRNWGLQHVIVDTRDWWPGGEVLVPLSDVDGIDWNGRSMRLRITREQARQKQPADALGLVHALHR